MDEALLLAVVALALVGTSDRPVPATRSAPIPPPKPGNKTWQDYVGGCLSTGITGASIGIVAGPKGAAVGGAVGCLLGIGTTAASDPRFA